MNGTANPRLAATTGWFRYSTTSPGATCNDTFGTRVPATGGTDLGSGSAAAPYAENLTGLTPGATYYFCAIAQNSVATSFGTVLSFVAPGAPVVATMAATAVGLTTATVNGSANPSGSATTGWFRYHTTDPGTCNDSFGTRAPASSGSSLGAGTTATAYSQALTGLAPATTYYYCAIAQNTEGTQFGLVLSFTTLSTPTVTTVAASAVSGTGATLNGTANPNGAAATGWFRYSTTSPGTTCNDTFGTRTPTSGGTGLGSGTTAAPYTAALTGLASGTTYYFCALASNSVGTAMGTVMSFTTPGAPSVTTVAASAISGTGATLNGTANPSAAATTGWFRYSATSPGACNDTFGTRLPATGGTDLGSGTTVQAFSQAITGLTLGTTYYFCAIAQNANGTRFGTLTPFTTLAAPTVTTVAASGVSGSGATLNGSANPRGTAATGWFRFDTTNPGTCNDTFGTRVPAAGGADLGSGTTAQTFNEPLIGLAPGTTYYYCAVAQNSAGTAWGSVMSFVTPNAPTATTLAATAISQTGATLNGSGNPRGAAATGYFRWSATNPGNCDDSFGTRVPASGGTSLGSGTADVAFSQALTGLTTSTTYWYCAIATSTEGTSYGAVMTVVTQGAPTVTTEAATAVTSTTATLNGTASANGISTTAWFRYSNVDPGACNNTFGSRAPTTGQASIGTGSTPVPYNFGVTGLTAGTTYYYCAIANNTVGRSYGAVLSFTTPGAPSVATLAATAISGTGATFNGSANPAAGASTGWFRYSTTNPGTCNDTFGTRTPATGGTDLGSGTAAVPYSQAVTGLTPGATYFFCAIASNASGKSYGLPLSFTTLSTPTMVSSAASAVSATGATLNGSGNPNGAAAIGWFAYSDTDPGICDDTFGIRVPATGGTDLGSGTTVTTYSQVLTGLTAGTTYWYCAIGANSVGSGFGTLRTFTTLGAPQVTTLATSAITTTGATLNGSANPRGASATGWFRYSTTSPGAACNDTFGTRAPATGGSSLGSGTTAASYNQAVTGLSQGTTYYFCAIAQNSVGTSFGQVLTFTTPSAPTVTTIAATSVTGTGATLNGTANPNGAASTGWFRYSTTSPGASCNDTFGTRTPTTGGTSLGSGTAAAPYSATLTGLAAGTTYYFCALASNAAGTAFGTPLSFTTPSAPVVTTVAASAIGGQAATLNGTANPGGATATGWFRYSTTSPGAACNDTFGTRTPATGGTDLGSGSAAAPFNQALSGLNPATTYYFCAIAQNSVGTRFGAVMSFTTQAGPTVTTLAATAVTAAGATVNGMANPNGVATTGWFRYATAKPATCDDTFGTRAPSTSGTSLGSGTAVQTFNQPLTGLAAGTTYWFCAIAQSSVGTSFGTLQSFVTPGAPKATTLAATAVAGTTATLNGEATGNGAATTGYFRYSAVNPATCDDVFGTRAPLTGGTNVGSAATPAPFSAALTGLSASTTYYYCAIARNSEGTSFGAVMSFTTQSAPAVTTVAATSVTGTGATLNGSANPNGTAATGWFRYATTAPASCNDTFGTRTPATGGTSLGSGTSAVSFGQTLTGLTAGTTYWYCAIASNAVGTSFGALMSVTTPASAPVVATAAPTLVTGATATFNGSATPNGAATTGWFRYAPTDPGTCNDTFGTREPATGGVSLGSGSASAPFAQAITGLAAGRTYYVCALAQNSAGLGVGTPVAFTTPDKPAVTTQAASGVTGTTAKLNGSANPNHAEATGWFRVDTTDPGTCDDTFGTRSPETGGTVLGAGAADVDFAQDLTGLVPGTTYYFCAIAENAEGKAFGQVQTLRTPGLPQVVTSSASNVTATAATLNGAANPNGADAVGYFRWATTAPASCDDTFGTRTPATGGTALGSGSADVPFSQPISGLSPGTTVWFCAIAQSPVGTGFGAVLSVQVSAPVPVVETLAAGDLEGTSATLNGTVNPNGTVAIGWFRYSTTAPSAAGCNDTFGTRAPAQEGITVGGGTSAVPFSVALTGLTPSTKYWFCALGSNTGGAGFGAVRTFKTAGMPPKVETKEATISGTKATLNGMVNPNGVETTGWFQIDTTKPEKCDDSFGRKVPSEDLVLGGGFDEMPLAVEVADLTADTTYWYCAVASSAAGTSYGEPMSVLVPAFNVAQQGCGCGATGGAAPASLGLALALLAMVARRRK
ncbi:MAG: MYXO-CTERM sorting domain-containing protein [Myxococcales bacterium]